MYILYNNKRFYIFLGFVFLLIMIYALQDFQTNRNTTGEVGLYRGGVHLAMLAILMVLGTYYALTTARGRILRSPVKAALWLIAGWIVVVNVFQNTIAWSMAVQLGLGVLWILAYHLLSYYLRHFPNAWPQIQSGITIMFGFYVFSALYGAHTIGKTYDVIAVVNLVYGVLVFLPWLSLMGGKRMRCWGFAVVFLMVLVSMKRGAILVFPLMLSAAALVEAVVRKKQLGRFVLKIILVMALLFAGLWTVDQWSGGFLTERLSFEQLVGGSGRSKMYGMILDDLSQRSSLDLFLGHGSGSVEQLLGGLAAHNEWLEFLSNYGIIGVVFYALLLLALARRLLKLMKRSSRYAAGYAMAIVYMLVVGMFGQIYFAHSTLYIMMFFGAVEGLMFNDARNVRVLGADFAHNCQQGAVQ